MANPLPKKRIPHDKNCTLGKPVEWFAENKGKWSDPNLREHCTCGNNPLDVADFHRMNLPRHLWGADLEGVTASVRPQVSKFLERIHKVRANAISLYLCGDPGVGKTGAAAVVLKEARAWGYTAFYISVERLREAYKERAAFDSELSVWERCRTVDFLLLDDLRESDIKERDFTVHDIRGLIVARNDKALVTLLTSTMLPKAWEKEAPGITNAIQQSCALLHVTGKNRHVATQEDKNSIFS